MFGSDHDENCDSDHNENCLVCNSDHNCNDEVGHSSTDEDSISSQLPYSQSEWPLTEFKVSNQFPYS